MFRQDYVELKSGSVICIPTSATRYIEYNPDIIADCYEEGVNAVATVFSASGFYDAVMQKEIISFNQLNSFIQPRTDQELADETFIILKNHIINNTVFLYGSLEEGGIFLYKANNQSKAYFGGCYGFYKDSDKKYYNISYESQGLSRSELGEIAITSYGASGISPDFNPDIKIFFVADGYKNNTIQNDALIYGDYNELLGTYIYKTSISLDVIMGKTGYTSGALRNYPLRPWKNQSSDPNLLYRLLPNSSYYSDALYGSIWDNSTVDPSINPSYKGGTSGTGGGNGDFPDRSDEIDITDLDDIDVDAVNSGFITLYNPTKAQVKSFSNFLWTDITDQLSTQIKRLIANPLDAVLFIAMCHFTPTNTGVSQVIKYCGISSNVSALLINTQRQSINCGTIHIPNSSNTFLDYAPYSKASIYLPYVGIQQLDINEVMGSDMTVVYHIDLLTGSATVQVKIERTKREIVNGQSSGDTDINAVLYEFTGQVYVQLPLTGSDWRSAINNMTSLITGAVGVATGNGAGLGAMASAVASQQVSVVKSGSISSNYGYVGHQKPYVILERPIDNTPVDQGHYEGYPSNLHYQLKNIIDSGYTEIVAGSWSADNINGTDAEMEEIKKYLESGVYI